MVKPRAISFYILLAAALFVFIETFALLAPILLALLLTLLISIAGNPVIARMRAWTGGRRGATGLIALLLVIILSLTAGAFLGPMKASITKLTEQLPGYWERLQKPLIKMEQQAVRAEEKLQAEVTTEIAQEKAAAAPAAGASRTAAAPIAKESGTIRSNLSLMVQGVFGRFAAVAFNTAQILVVLVTVCFGVIFTLMNPRPIFRTLFALIPKPHHNQALTILQRIGKFVPRWAGATLLAMLTIGLLTFLLMWPIFGFMDALVLGLIAGMLEAIPYLGPILSAVPALLFALGKGGLTPVWVLGVYVAIQALENNVITPLIMARNLKLHPVAVIFSMLLCVSAFGVLGVLVAAPVVAIGGILHDELYRKRFLPTVTDADLERLACLALHENESGDN